MSNRKLIVDYENLLQARGFAATRPHEGSTPLIEEIRTDISEEYNSNLDQKIERWIDVTRVPMWIDTRAVQYYIQAKMLYRDAFYEATIMAARSVCELVCYEILDGISHPFGDPKEVERVNFRRLASFVHDQSHLPDHSYELLNQVYDFGNKYVHPKTAQNPQADARSTLLMLGEALWGLYGVDPAALRAGDVLETAYSAFPDICNSYHFWMPVYASPEAAHRPEVGDSKGEALASRRNRPAETLDPTKGRWQ